MYEEKTIKRNPMMLQNLEALELDKELEEEILEHVDECVEHLDKVFDFVAEKYDKIIEIMEKISKKHSYERTHIAAASILYPPLSPFYDLMLNNKAAISPTDLQGQLIIQLMRTIHETYTLAKEQAQAAKKEESCN